MPQPAWLVTGRDPGLMGHLRVIVKIGIFIGSYGQNRRTTILAAPKGDKTSQTAAKRD
jgi:hypothetical protein